MTEYIEEKGTNHVSEGCFNMVGKWHCTCGVPWQHAHNVKQLACLPQLLRTK